MEDSAHQRSLVFTTNTNTTNDWQPAVVRIGSRPIMRVTFEGVRGQDYQGDIALDDISFETCQGKLSLLLTDKLWECQREKYSNFRILDRKYPLIVLEMFVCFAINIIVKLYNHPFLLHQYKHCASRISSPVSLLSVSTPTNDVTLSVTVLMALTKRTAQSVTSIT